VGPVFVTREPASTAKFAADPSISAACAPAGLHPKASAAAAKARILGGETIPRVLFPL
jgi:hypothetical protein